MTDETELVSVVTHLTKEETERVKKILSSNKIDFLVNESGPQSRYRIFYFQIRVQKKDYPMAKQVIDNQQAEIFKEGRICPSCKHLGYKSIKKKGLWEKIYYVGTTRVECNKCGYKFFI